MKGALVFDENYSHRVITFFCHESTHTLLSVRNLSLPKPDREWMPIVAARGGVICTCDRNPKTRAITNPELVELGARVVLFGPFLDHLGGWDRVKWLAARVDKLMLGVNQIPYPAWVALCDRTARLELLERPH